MGQIHLTDPERVQSLARFDYSEVEARFLCLAALHGGYFLRRQAAQFLERADGGSVTALIDKIFAHGHATARAFDRNVHLYHLGARSFYAALGQSDNRNRRERECSTIKQKLMGLDFVLAHPENVFLATEEEKLQYFLSTLGLPESALPARTYRSTKTSPTTRFFVEKYPIFLPSRSHDQVPFGTPVSFCFIDEGLTTSAHFETFLGHYSRLFAALAAVRVVYVSDRVAPFHGAEAVMKKRLVRGESGRNSATFVKRLVSHFGLRSRYEARQFDGFDRATLIQLRDDQTEFTGPKFDSYYELWKAGGDAAVRQILAPQAVSEPRPALSFSTHLLENNYDFLGTLTSR